MKAKTDSKVITGWSCCPYPNSYHIFKVHSKRKLNPPIRPGLTLCVMSKIMTMLCRFKTLLTLVVAYNLEALRTFGLFDLLLG